MLKQVLKIATLYTLIQQGYVLYTLSNIDVEKTLRTQDNEAQKGLQFESIEETDTYTKRHTIEDGIERIVYTPKKRKYDTPIVMQHGMWHGAWCWETWQMLLAEWGWETHAHSLPNHAGSHKQRPMWQCTLDYYLSFLKREIDRQPVKPILMGHSMGGALTQWYLKYVGDNLPATVLVAPWVSHSAMLDGIPLIFKSDPMALILTWLQWNANSWVRDPYYAAQKLISNDAIIKPVDLYNKLDGESVMVTMQHNPPFWKPAENVKTPMLWLSGEKDTVVSEAGQRKSAAFYDADYHMIPEAAHNLMMEKSYYETAQYIHNWLDSISAI